MLKMKVILTATIALFMTITPLCAATIGVSTDLFPAGISITTGNAGGSIQAWYGTGNLKFRLVAAHIHLPDSLLKNDSLQDLSMNVGALLVDYVFGKNLTGFWIGGGAEIWRSTISNKTGTHVHKNNFVLTLGGGHIWSLGKNWYINPWAAIHWLANSETIRLDSTSWKQKKIEFTASVKIGFRFNVGSGK